MMTFEEFWKNEQLGDGNIVEYDGKKLAGELAKSDSFISFGEFLVEHYEEDIMKVCMTCVELGYRMGLRVGVPEEIKRDEI